MAITKSRSCKEDFKKSILETAKILTEKADEIVQDVDTSRVCRVSITLDLYPGGVGTMSGEEVNAMISSIETFLSENEVDENTKAFIENLLQQIKDIPVIEGAST